MPGVLPCTVAASTADIEVIARQDDITHMYITTCDTRQDDDTVNACIYYLSD